MSVPVPFQAPFYPVTETTVSASKPQPKYKIWHETLIDLMLQHPDWNGKRLAQELGKTPATIYMVIGSHMFKARLAMRREEHNQNISFAIIAKTTRIAEKSLAQLEEKLDDNAVSKKISARDLGEIANEALTRIGLGPKSPDIIVNTQVNGGSAAVTVSSDALLRARGRLRQNEAVLSGSGEAAAVTSYGQPAAPVSGQPLVIDAIVNEEARAPILDELMHIGDEDSNAREGEQSSEEVGGPPPGAGKGEGG